MSGSRLSGRIGSPRFALLGFTLAIILFSCKKKEDPAPPPVAPPQVECCFKPSSRFVSGTAEVVQFTNCSKNHDRSEWNFGDGTSSVLSEPSHVWEKAGVYDVTLTVFRGQETRKASEKIYVGQKGKVTLNISFSNWKWTGNTMYNTSWYAQLYRAPDNAKLNGYYASAPFAPKDTPPRSGAFELAIGADGGFFVKLGVSCDGVNDTLNTVKFNVIDGPSAPSGYASLKTCDVSYSVATSISP